MKHTFHYCPECFAFMVDGRPFCFGGCRDRIMGIPRPTKPVRDHASYEAAYALGGIQAAVTLWNKSGVEGQPDGEP